MNLLVFADVAADVDGPLSSDGTNDDMDSKILDDLVALGESLTGPQACIGELDVDGATPSPTAAGKALPPTAVVVDGTPASMATTGGTPAKTFQPMEH